jgi:hypothetical protein
MKDNTSKPKPRRRLRPKSASVTNAQTYVFEAKELFQMTYAEIAKLCNVNEGTVQRWVSSNKASKVAIAPLIEKIESTTLKPSDLSKKLTSMEKFSMERYGKSPLIFTYQQLRTQSGLAKLVLKYIADLQADLEEKGYQLLKYVTSTNITVYALINESHFFESDCDIKKLDADDDFINDYNSRHNQSSLSEIIYENSIYWEIHSIVDEKLSGDTSTTNASNFSIEDLQATSESYDKSSGILSVPVQFNYTGDNDVDAPYCGHDFFVEAEVTLCRSSNHWKLKSVEVNNLQRE